MTRALGLFVAAVVLMCTACENTARVVIPGVMNVASIGYDDSAIALSSSEEPCDRNGEPFYERQRGEVVTTLFLFFGTGPMPTGEHAVPGDLDSDDFVTATLRVGSATDTCDTRVFVTDWEGTIAIDESAPDGDGDIPFALDIESASSNREIEGRFDATTRCERAVFELGNFCEAG